jgi:hypothetical protein
LYGYVLRNNKDRIPKKVLNVKIKENIQKTRTWIKRLGHLIRMATAQTL